MYRRIALAWGIVAAVGLSAHGQLRPGPCSSCAGAATPCVTHAGGAGAVSDGGGAGIGWGSTRAKNLGAGPMDVLPTRTALGRLGLERAWFAYIPLAATESAIEVSHDEDMVFVQTNQAHLYALDAESGQLLWGASLGESNPIAEPVSVNSTSVFVTNGNQLLQLSRSTGRLVRQIRLESFATSPTAANEQLVVVGLETGQLVGYNVGEPPADQPYAPRPGTHAFTWKSANRLTSRPIVTDSQVAFGSQDRRLFVTMNRPPGVLYRFLTAGPIVGGLASYGTRTLLVPSADNTLYAVDLFDPGDNQQIHWELATGAPLRQQPIVAGETIYIINDRGVLFSVDPKTGQSNWSRPTNGADMLAASPKRIYMVTPERDLVIFDRATGDNLASAQATRDRAGLNLRQYGLHVVNADNDRLFLASKQGQIVSLRELGQVEAQPLRTPGAVFGTIPTGGDRHTKVQEALEAGVMPGNDEPMDQP